MFHHSPPAKVSALMSHSLSDKLPFGLLAVVSLQSARELVVAAAVPPVGHFPRLSPPLGWRKVLPLGHTPPAGTQTSSHVPLGFSSVRRADGRGAGHCNK